MKDKPRSNIVIASLVAVGALIAVLVLGYFTVGSEPNVPTVMPIPSVTPPPTIVHKSSAAEDPNATHQNTAIASGMPSFQVQIPEENNRSSVIGTAVAPTAESNSRSARGTARPHTHSGSSVGIKMYVAVARGAVVDVSYGARKITVLHLNGYLASWANKQRLSWMRLRGCRAPILVWNAGMSNGSAAFGMDSSGTYQAFASTGGYDMAPDGGDGSTTYEYGVYDKRDHVVYREKGMPVGQYHQFYGCDSTGMNLHYSGTGD